MTFAPSTVQHIQWMWKATKNPWSTSHQAKWRPYSDVETAIIEQAYVRNLPMALLDAYYINFKHLVQVSNHNVSRQRPVIRMVNGGSTLSLREERFLPNPIRPVAPFTVWYDGIFDRGFLNETRVYFGLNKPGLLTGGLSNAEVRRMVVEKAAKGLIVEGKQLGKQREAEWMAQQLLNVRYASKNNVWGCCARLYCMESFLYKKLNEIMRLDEDKQYEALLKSKVPTLGPFALLLADLPDYNQTMMTVYRGVNLSDEFIQKYLQKDAKGAKGQISDPADCIMFPAFTSTSRNRVKAEEFGNVLLIIVMADQSSNMSAYSEYPEEEELLFPPFVFSIQSCIFDMVKNKWIIHLQSACCPVLPN